MKFILILIMVFTLIGCSGEPKRTTITLVSGDLYWKAIVDQEQLNEIYSCLIFTQPGTSGRDDKLLCRGEGMEKTCDMVEIVLSTSETCKALRRFYKGTK